jgi:hypothetical protein
MNKTFEDINEATFGCLKQKIATQGITMEGESGYLSKNGISLDFNYSSGTQTLSIENLEVGFPASLAGMNTEKVLGILEKTITDCR